MTAALARPRYVPMTFGATWRQRLVFAVALIVAIVAVSELADHGAPTRTVSGTVIEYLPNEAIGIAGEQFDPGGFRLTIRDSTRFEGFAGPNAAPVLRPGAYVQVTYKSVGERRSVADRVRLLEDVGR